MVASTSGVLVDDDVIEVLRKSQLEEFLNKFVFDLQVRRFDHFAHVRDNDMRDIGMQQNQIRLLRDQTIKMSREMWNRSEPKQIYIECDNASSSQNTIDERTLIPNEQIKLYEKLGEGSFAVVKRGIWVQNDGRKVDVAVKILRDISPTIVEDLRVEASHLLKLQHPSLIRLYGIVRQPAMMVFELCEGGSLLDRLRDDKKKIPLVSQLLEYCVQISKALQFLESKHCVHRDVAARNILLSKDELSVKICDFGLMRALKDNEQMYTMAPQKKVPFAWCPPESLRHRKFSHASDVWSYGVTIWEIFTFGEEPWVGCRAIDVLKNIDNNERLEKPKYCSEKIYQIMLNCWKTNPTDRIKFGMIREDLKSAMFLNAVVREAYKSIQNGTLQLNVSDEVIVIENTGQDWYGQNKKNQNFGFFPRTCVFVQSNNAVSAASAVTPQKLPTAPQIKLPKQMPLPTVVHRNVMDSSQASGSSRISMPVQGSFIHTGHGDPLGGQSWGTPSSIDMVYLKNPVKGVPLSRTNGAEIIQTKSQLSNGGRNVQVAPFAPTRSSMLSLHLPDISDDFEKAFNDSFSPSAIELPRQLGNGHSNINSISVHKSEDFGTFLLTPTKPPDVQYDIRGNAVQPNTVVPDRQSVGLPLKPVLIAPANNGIMSIPMPESSSARQPGLSHKIDGFQPRHTSSAGSRLDSMATNNNQPPKNFSNGNMPQNLIPELKNRLDSGSDAMRQRPASSIGLPPANEFQFLQNPYSQQIRPTSVIQPTTSAGLPCLVPTRAPDQILAGKQTPLQKALADELKGNLNKKPTSGDVSNGQSPRRQTQPIEMQPKPFVQPQVVMIPALNPTPAPVAMAQPKTQISNAQPTAAPIQQHRPSSTRTKHDVPKTVAPSQQTPVAPSHQISAAPSHQAPVAPTHQAPAAPVQVPKPTPAAEVTRRAVSTDSRDLSHEDRRSKIIAEISSALPAPSSLLLGATTTASPTAPKTTVTTSVPRPVVPTHHAQPAPQPAVVTKPPAPVLSMNVLEPIKLPSATNSARNSSPPTVQNVAPVQQQNIDKKPTAPVQNTQVPLFNITNSTTPHSIYPSLGGGYQSGNGAYIGFGGAVYNPYNQYGGYNPSYMGQMGMQPTPVILPPLPSENNRSSPHTAQQLPDAEIQELLGQHGRPGPSHAPSTSTAAATAPTELSMSEKMEILYKDANFTAQGNCDSMVVLCNGNIEIALKRLKIQHLVTLGLAPDENRARAALESRDYDLTAAANMLLG